MIDPARQEEARQEMRHPRPAEPGRNPADRVLAELRGKRFIDQTKDTQFSDAWIILGVLLTIIGVIARNGFLLAGAGALLVLPVLAALWNRLALFGVEYTRKLSET